MTRPRAVSKTIVSLVAGLLILGTAFGVTVLNYGHNNLGNSSSNSSSSGTISQTVTSGTLSVSCSRCNAINSIYGSQYGTTISWEIGNPTGNNNVSESQFKGNGTNSYLIDWTVQDNQTYPTFVNWIIEKATTDGTLQVSFTLNSGITTFCQNTILFSGVVQGNYSATETYSPVSCLSVQTNSSSFSSTFSHSSTTTQTTTISSSSTNSYQLSFQQEFASGSILSSTCMTLANEGVWEQDYGSGTGSSGGFPPQAGSSGAILFDCGNGNVAFNVNSQGYETPTFTLPSAFAGLYLVIAPGQYGYADDPCNITSLSIHNNPIASGQAVQFSSDSGEEAGAYNYCLTYSDWPSSFSASFQISWSNATYIPIQSSCTGPLNCPVGYARVDNSNNTSQEVEAETEFTVPTMNCGVTPNGIVNIVTGLWNTQAPPWNGQSTAFWSGISASCNNGIPGYSILTNIPVSNSNWTPSVGDLINASVLASNGYVFVTLNDLTTGQSSTGSISTSFQPVRSECSAGPPEQTLVDFGTIDFYNCYTKVIGNPSNWNTLYAVSIYGQDGTLLASPSAPMSDYSFTVSWLASS